MGLFIYPLGISTNPNQVMIGKDNWLYLGDLYEKTITVRRRGATAEDLESAKKIRLATDLWEQWLKRRGVLQAQIILGPDKGTIYPEFLPFWARPAAASATDTLLANVSKKLYVDTRPALRSAKSQYSEALYYKTDTHWNSLGAWVAFRAFAKEFDRKEGGLRWLSDQQVHVLAVNQRKGGDLANFLKIAEMLPDSEVVIQIDSEYPIETEQYDFDTANLTASGGNPPIGPPQHPLLVKSRNALNQKRVLWLRDSFGTAMAPFMAATFNETLQIHYGATDPALLARLVDTFKPDYVFITVVERGARGQWFANPPPLFASGKQKTFISLSQGQPSGRNDLTEVEGTAGYRISGVDPFVTFSLAPPVSSQEAAQLVFELDCGKKKSEPIQIQVFWHGAGTSFNEVNSAHFATSPGITGIDLAMLSQWAQTGVITDIRIDVDSPNTCPVLDIKSVEVGK